METSRSADYRDSGWAWVVDFAGFLMMALSLGLKSALGILLVELNKYFEASVAQSSLLLSTSGISFTLSAIFLNTTLGGVVHERALATLGSVVGSVGFLVAFFSRSLDVTTICLGLCFGVTMEMCMFASMSMTPRYFNKRLAVANGLLACGTSSGMLAWPILMRYLIDTYTYRGAALIFSAILLNGVVCAALMRPVPGSTISSKTRKGRKKGAVPLSVPPVASVVTENKKQINGSASDSVQTASSSINRDEEVSFHELDLDDRVVVQSEQTSSREHVHNNAAFGCFDYSPEMIQHSPVTLEPSEKLMTRKSTLEQHQELTRTKSTVILPPTLESDGQDVINHNRATSHNIFKQFVLIQQNNEKRRLAIIDIFTLSLFKNPAFVLFQVYTLFFSIGRDYLVLFYPAVTYDLGFTEYQSAFLLSIIGLSGIFGRLLLGFVGDLVPKHYLAVVVVTQAILALVIALCPFLETFWAQAVLAVVTGIVYGAPYVFKVPLLLDFFNAEDMPKMLGINLSFGGMGIIVGTTLSGWLRDLRGDYSLPSYVSAALILTNCGILLSMALLRKRFKGKSDSYDLHAKS